MIACSNANPLLRLVGLTLTLTVSSAAVAAPREPAASAAPVETNHLSLARGTIPVALDEQATALRLDSSHALKLIDGHPGKTNLTPRPGGPETAIGLVYQLPARTTFRAFGVPSVGETPSPSQTFFRLVEIAGSDEGPDGPFVPLARVELEAHSADGEVTRFDAAEALPVRWLRVRLSGGLDIQRDATFFEFSELMGFGDQEPVPRAENLEGKWRGRGVRIELKQDGQRVSGCYDGDGTLAGTVDGRLLRATGTTRGSGTPSTFLLTVTDEGDLLGVRSSNGAPFVLYTGGRDPDLVTDCSQQEVALPGCDAILHGIGFDFDSAAIRADSEALLDDLYAGLGRTDARAITIVGHSSSEGDASYNADLSRRRAESVKAALIERGFAGDRLSAFGAGESRPIADNETDAGRALNRRVEIECTEPG